MNNKEVKNNVPENLEELKKAASRTSSWRDRIDAIDELGQWKSKQTIEILKTRMINDPVYKIQKIAFHKLQAFGEDVQLPPKKKGDLVKGASKIFLRIKKSLPEGHTYEEFKEKLKKMRLDVYDMYEGEKGTEFDSWLETTWTSLQK
ncbi:HEAT repeat domain-containing protein [Neobacillus sp. PS3-40]|uniref:HEAT repeat domain-containing protein n=1 Tax=Neobacillus sp. PS3-40 TaxID=3070679 RepID=UPI0027DEC147|nr:HEAT repeat domain-containing protein [Neobacillus sp. PS3-40]WML44691.1 HEAT repeat domain-containing protein [Neobacillus sp. PS3-40]